MVLAPQTPKYSLSEINGASYVFVGPGVLVASNSTPGIFYLTLDGKCSCLGYKHRGSCRHLRTAAEAMEQDRATAEPTNMVWGGNDHGWVALDEATRQRTAKGGYVR